MLSKTYRHPEERPKGASRRTHEILPAVRHSCPASSLDPSSRSTWLMRACHPLPSSRNASSTSSSSRTFSSLYPTFNPNPLMPCDDALIPADFHADFHGRGCSEIQPSYLLQSVARTMHSPA